jgi:hypothetical protein
MSAQNEPHCEGTTNELRVGAWRYEKVPCAATRGLISFTDWNKRTRYTCRWHRAEVERRYGVYEKDPVLA